ncbi:protein kinase domain-containing protein [Frankia canadensis]|nr:protein kinase [Frankia canadensis]
MVDDAAGRTPRRREPGDPLNPHEPRSIGPYTLISRLGVGGMGTVYLARNAADRRVAVKVIRPDLAADEEFRRRFRAEVEAARRVAPFCTAEVLDADPNAPAPYLVTEFIDGVRLDEQVDQGPLASSTLTGLAVGVATALTAIHSAGLVHRDLKPSNVMLSLSGPRVIDFGIAQALDGAKAKPTAWGFGSAGWMAPEQVHGQPIGPEADVFAWGILIAYAGTGRHPFGDGSDIDLGMRIVGAPPDLGGLREPLVSLVSAALAKHPDDRPSARELLLRLIAQPPARGGGSHGPAIGQVEELLSRTGEVPRPAPTRIGPATSAPARRPPWNGGAVPPARPEQAGPPGRSPGMARPGPPGGAPMGPGAALGPGTTLGAGSTLGPGGNRGPGGTTLGPGRTALGPGGAAAGAPPGAARPRGVPYPPGVDPTGGRGAPVGGPGQAPYAGRPATAGPGPLGARGPTGVPSPAGPRDAGPPGGRPRGAAGPWIAPGGQGAPGTGPLPMPGPGPVPGGATGAGYPPYAQPAPARRGPDRRQLALIAGVLLAAIIGIAIVVLLPDRGDDGQHAGSQSGGTGAASTTAPGSAQPSTMAGFGSTVTDGGLQFVVAGLDCSATQIGDGLLALRANGRFCQARVTVRNTSGTSVALDNTAQLLWDNRGERHEANFLARFKRHEDLWDAIDPGDTKQGTLVFDVPQDAVPQVLELHESPQSPGVKISVR